MEPRRDKAVKGRKSEAPMPRSILIAEDEQVLRESLAELLEQEGYEVVQAPNGRVAHETALERPFDLVLADVRMPEMDGLALLANLRRLAPQTPVVILTAYGTVDSAVESMRAGAADYLLKPIQFEDLLLKVERALAHGEMWRANRLMTEQLAAECAFDNLVGQAASMQRLFEMVRRLAAVKSTVLIFGESGTGKELIARAIHYNGVTRDKPFVPVNCGAIPETLIASELFGHRKGSFTGATADRVGYFEAAGGGTLFLDEISTLPLATQSMLLRVLEERVVVPVGDTRGRPVDVRIIAATNRDLREMVSKGQFREDLMYRLDVVKLELPPLRQRREDIPLLAHHFLKKYASQMNKPVPGMTNGAMRALLSHDWPGNIRELENVIERAVIFADSHEVGAADLPFGGSETAGEAGEELREALRQFERQHILYSLRRHGYDKNECSRHLGIGLSSLYRKMEELGISKSDE